MTDSNLSVSDNEWALMDDESSSLEEFIKNLLSFYEWYEGGMPIFMQFEEMRRTNLMLDYIYFFDNLYENLEIMYGRMWFEGSPAAMEEIKNRNERVRLHKQKKLKDKFSLYNKSNVNIDLALDATDILSKIDKINNELTAISQNKCVNVIQTELNTNEMNLDLMDISDCLEYNNKNITALSEELNVKYDEFNVLLCNNSTIMDNLDKLFYDTIEKVCNLEGILDNFELYIRNNGFFSGINLIMSVNRFINNNIIDCKENNAIVCVFNSLIGGMMNFIISNKTSSVLATIGTDTDRRAPWYSVQSFGINSINNDINAFIVVIHVVRNVNILLHQIYSTQRQYKCNFYVP